MTFWALALSLSGIHLLAVMSPGPDFILTIRNAITYSRKTGILTAIGLGLGVTIHILYCSLGLGLVISQSILLFNLIKYAGAAYLIFIGIQALRATPQKSISVEKKQAPKPISSLKAIQMGFLTNVLNPKATVYFLSVFSVVISPNLPISGLMILSAIMVIITILWFALLAVFITHPKILSGFNKAQNKVTRAFGGLLVLLGIKIAITN